MTAIIIPIKDDFILDSPNPETESMVFSYNSIEADFKIINKNNEIVFWDEIQKLMLRLEIL